MRAGHLRFQHNDDVLNLLEFIEFLLFCLAQQARGIDGQQALEAQLPVFCARKGYFQQGRSTPSTHSHKEICFLKGLTWGASPSEVGVRLCRKIAR